LMSHLFWQLEPDKIPSRRLMEPTTRKVLCEGFTKCQAVALQLWPDSVV